MIARFAAEQTAGLGCPVLYGVEGGTRHRKFYDSVRRGRANRFRRAPDRFHRAGRYALTAVLEDRPWDGMRSSRLSTTRSSMG